MADRRRSVIASPRMERRGLGRLVRFFGGSGAPAVRAADASIGSSLPSRRSRRSVGYLGVVLVAVVAALALPAAGSAAPKQVDRFIGNPVAGGARTLGWLAPPRDLAVNTATGDVYVSDSNTLRVTRFSAAGVPELTWGRDVAATNAGTGGEVCSTACQVGERGNGKGEFANPAGLAVDQATGDVYVWDRYGGTFGFPGSRVQKFDADGNFILMFGEGVNATTGGDVCTEASGDVCGAAVPGDGAGQLGATANFDPRLAVGPGGDVFVADPANGRVAQFESDGDFVRAWGWGVDTGAEELEVCTGASGCQAAVMSGGDDNGRFAFNSPVHIAVDSAGIVYAADTTLSERVLRFDPSAIPTPASAGAAPAGFLLPAIGAPPLVEGNTVGLKVDLDTDGAGPDEDRLLVARAQFSNAEVVVQELGGLAVGDTPTVAETHGVGLGFGDVLGTLQSRINALGVDSGTGNILLGGNFEQLPGVYVGYFVLDVDGTPGLGVNAALAPSDVGADSAMVQASVNPQGLGVYRIEVSSDGVNWSTVEEEPIDTMTDTTVSADLTGLEPNSTYRMRVVLTKITGPATMLSSTSNEVVFVTDSAAPEATTRGVHSYTDTDAWLAGDVDPNSASTTYRFQWGLTTSYGEQVPLSDGNAGSGPTPKAVLHQIQGLAPNTTYHYRLVAESPGGTDFGADHTFTTRPAFGGFAQRGYEQVSPPDKNSVQIDFGPASADGSVSMLTSVEAMADSPFLAGVSGMLHYRSQRNPAGDGWTTKAVLPRPGGFDSGLGASTVSLPFIGGPGQRIAAIQGILENRDDEPNLGGWLRDVTVGSAADLRSDDLVEVTPPFQGDVPDYLVGASADMRHVIFESTRELTPDAPAAPANKLYEWVDGTIRLVSVDESGVPFAEGGLAGSQRLRRDAVSDDGRHVLFTAPAVHGSNEAKIYRRSDGSTTKLVSPSKAAAADPLGEKAKRFAGATLDGDMVFFISAEELTDDANTGPSRAGADLYRYQASTDTLIDVSADGDDPNGASVQAVLGNSKDGRWVYYVAQGQVVAGQGTLGASNVYVWHDDGSADGETRFVTTLGSGDGHNFGSFYEASDSSDLAGTSRVSADGRSLVLRSSRSLTGYANRGTHQLYLYEAEADGGTGELTCVSCRPSGAASGGGAVGARPTSGTYTDAGDRRPEFLAADGRRVAFESDDRLLAGDVNGVRDVYLWQDGRLSLVSTGTSSVDSRLQGISDSGNDVFFLTFDQLVGQDTDGAGDVYTARVGGGIPQQNPASAGVVCGADSCRAPGGPPAAPGSPPSATSGDGNVDSGVRARLGRPVVRAADRRRAVRIGRLRVAVRSNVSGRLVATAASRLSGRSVARVGRGRVTLRRAGVARFDLRLSRAARARLGRTGRLTLTVVARLSPVVSSRGRVTLRVPERRSARRATVPTNQSGR